MQVLERLGVEAEEVRKRLVDAVRRGKATIALGELPYTSRAKKTLEYAMAEAREAGQKYVGTEHLVLGLLREEKGIAAQVLNSLGVTIERARTAMRQVLAGEPPEPELRVEIDDASELSIYEQIVARVQEAIATGELKPGDRLPTVRRLADQLDIAPGTVARAYGELERVGAVVTEGARGTRVAERAGPSASRAATPDTLAGLLRPVAVAAFHMGAGAEQLRAALEEAMKGIFKG
jgi:ATP-dependent Clp protease ATP-binding subunit ClpC